MIKLAKLPDRTPVKVSIIVTPDLARALADYTALYNETYDSKIEAYDLIPAMLENFLASDKTFIKGISRKP